MRIIPTNAGNGTPSLHLLMFCKESNDASSRNRHHQIVVYLDIFLFSIDTVSYLITVVSYSHNIL